MKIAHALSLAFALGISGWSHEAEAFSAADKFAAPVSEGGGAGRYFTASYQDGYGCSVCHSGGVPPVLHVNGLPLNGYQPGASYEVEVTWEKPHVHHALNLELIGRDGRVPGQVALVDGATVDARGRCGGIMTGTVPAFERTVGMRKVLGIEACDGVSSMRFRFTPANVSELAFSLSAITSNRLATVDGDGVTTIRKVLRRVGEPAKTGDCSLSRGASLPGSSLWSGLLLLPLAALFARRLRARRSAR